MPTYQIGLDDGRSLKIEADSQEAALAGVQHFQDSEKPSGAVAGLQEGLSKAISGPAATLGLTGADTSKMDAAAQAVAPKDYKSAPVLGPNSHWYNPASYDWKNVPQMVAENAPQMAEGMAGARAGAALGAKVGPWGAAIGGAVGGAAPFVLNTLGDTSKANAATRTGTPDAKPAGEDILRATGTVLPQAAIQSLGISRLVGPGASAALNAVGAKGVAQSIARGAATTGIEGATGAATDAVGQVGATLGTDGGLKVNPDEVANAGVGQAILGGGMAMPKMLANASAANKYAKFGGDNAAATEIFANRVKDAADGASLKNTKNAFDAVRQAYEDTIAQLKDAAQAAGPASAETEAAIGRATKGRVLTDADHAEIETNSTPDVAALARQAHVGAMLKGEGDFSTGPGTFTGGIANSVGQHIRALQNPTGAVASGILGATVGGSHAASLFAYTPETMAAIGTAYGLMRGVDGMTGNRSPANKFVNKFSTDAPVPTAPTAPVATVAPPATTSVPQINPPSAPVHPWGAPPPAPAAPMNAAAMQQQVKSALLMAAARRNVAAQQAAAAAPSPAVPPNASAMNEQVKSALLMAAARRNVAGQQDAEAEARGSHAINEQGGLDALSNPALGKRANELLSNANALRRLRAVPEEDAPPVVPPHPTEPTGGPNDIPSFLPQRAAATPELPQFNAPQPPAAPVAPTADPIADMINHLRNRYPVAPVAEKITKKSGGDVKAPVAAAPAETKSSAEAVGRNYGEMQPGATEETVKREAMYRYGNSPQDHADYIRGFNEAASKKYEDNPYPEKVTDTSAPRDFTKADTSKLTPHDAVNSKYDVTNEYVPLQAHELHGKDMTHDQFAAKETADKLGQVTNKGTPMLEKENAQAYHDAVVRDRVKRERTLQELSQSSTSENDTPTLQALLEQLHHIRRGETARAAIYHYTSMMSAPLRTKVLRRLDSSFVHHMWSKEN